MARQAIRVGRIEIDTLKPNAPQWITSTIQTLEVDDNDEIISQLYKDAQLIRRVSEVTTQVVSITDPVTQQVVNLSVAGLGTAIKAVMINWMLEDNVGSAYDPGTDLVMLDGSNI